MDFCFFIHQLKEEHRYDVHRLSTSTGVAPRLASLRDWRRSATNFFLSMLTILMLVGVGAQAQQPFDFGSDANRARSLCPGLVFLYDGGQSPTDYSVTLTVFGMVFDHSQEYSRQLSEMTTIIFDIDSDTGTTGFYHSNQTDLYPPASPGNVTHTRPERLGAGRYRISITYDNTTTEFTLDLTDANWADGGGGSAGFRNILVEPYTSGTGRPKVWISDASPTVYNNNIDCGAVPAATGHTDRYWELVRHDSPTYIGYQRDRNGFSIDPSYRGPSQYLAYNTSEVPYGVYYAQSDVDIEVQGSISIPSGRHWFVTTDPDVINSPYVEQTLIGFNSGTGLTIENGGTLTSTGSTLWGVVDWFCFTGGNKGDWIGIAGEPGATIIMNYATISDAVVGLKLEQTTTYDMEVILVDNSRDYGIEIIDSNPQMLSVDVNASGSSSGAVNGANVKIEGAPSATFTVSSFRNAVKLSTDSTFNSGHGVTITGSGEAMFSQCVVHNNAGYGYNLQNTDGPYILDNDIRYNAAGIYAKETSHWTTLRESRVHDNTFFGVRLIGTDSSPIRLRGWYHSDPAIDPTNPADVDQILAYQQFEGLNCVYLNDENLRAENARYDLGSQYTDGGGATVLLGAKNSIFSPTGPYQSTLSDDSYGGFMDNWWDGNHNIVAYNPATYDDNPELGNDEVGCTEMGKAVADGAGSLTGDLLLYRRTRGSMQLSEERVQMKATATEHPSMMFLAEPYPNPFNPQTSIALTLFERQDITLVVTDVLGRTVATLANGYYDAGRYSVMFDAGSLPSGMYHVVLRSASSVQSRRLLLTK